MAERCIHRYYDPHEYTPIDFLGDLISMGAHTEGREKICMKCGHKEGSTNGRLM